MQENQADIIIAGAGIAGKIAALAFIKAGYSVFLVDAKPVEAGHGFDLRTTAFLAPSCAFLEKIGLWQRLSSVASPLETMRIVEASNQDAVKSYDFSAAEIDASVFGWNAPNTKIHAALDAALTEAETLTWVRGVEVNTGIARTSGVSAWLSDGRRVQGALLIGADGRNSRVRDIAKIGVKTFNHGQKALAFSVYHSKPHFNCSTEIHEGGGPFTFVPLPDQMGEFASAVIWMETGTIAENLMHLNESDFNAAAKRRSHGILGDLTLNGARNIWPIITQMADDIVAQRIALIAEAAHVVPPIGAQGLNTSLADIESLVDAIQVKGKEDPGSMEALKAFSRARWMKTAGRMGGLAALNAISALRYPALTRLRGVGLDILGKSPWLKDKAMRLGLDQR